MVGISHSVHITPTATGSTYRLQRMCLGKNPRHAISEKTEKRPATDPTTSDKSMSTATAAIYPDNEDASKPENPKMSRIPILRCPKLSQPKIFPAM